METFSGNFCAIAQCIITKKCCQVYQFSRLDEATAGDDPAYSRNRRATTKVKKKKQKRPQFKKRNSQLQLFNAHGEGDKNTQPYSPCHHPGKKCSEEAYCSCKQAKNFCEKYCHCPPDCQDRFTGCRCKSSCTSRQCPCYLSVRECDPDLCRTCLDKGLELDMDKTSCRNIALQRGWGKKLYIAPSDVAGWGCFIGEPAAKNEFIGEYFGEMITELEADRREYLFGKKKCSYMFKLNEEYVIDAGRFGGKMRFANHSSHPNCETKILLVNGDHRIGIYASRNIEAGEELLFNYGHDHFDSDS